MTSGISGNLYSPPWDIGQDRIWGKWLSANRRIPEPSLLHRQSQTSRGVRRELWPIQRLNRMRHTVETQSMHFPHAGRDSWQVKIRDIIMISLQLSCEYTIDR